jgi:hypothetical protein
MTTAFCNTEMRFDYFRKPCRNDEQERREKRMRKQSFSGPDIPKMSYAPAFPLRSGPEKLCFVTHIPYGLFIVIVDSNRALSFLHRFLISQNLRVLLR